MDSSVHRHVATIDLNVLVDRMVSAAIAVTTGRLNLAAARETRSRLVRGEGDATGYFRFELARQIGSALLALDPHVVAVFEDQDAPPSEEVAHPEPDLYEPIRLIVQSEIESFALSATIAAINEALGHALGDTIGCPPYGLVQATVVDSRDNRLLRARAYGFRPAPVLVASREDTFTDGIPG